MKDKKGRLSVWFSRVKYILNKSYRDNIPALAGQSAFFLILSAIPMLLFVFSLFSMLTGEDLKVSDFLAITNQIGFPYTDKLINYIVDSVHKATSGTAVITAIVMLWSAGKGIYCVTDGIMRIYRIPNNKFWLLKRLYAMGYTVVMLLIILLGLVIVMANFIFAGYLSYLTAAFSQFRWVILVLLYLVFGLLQTLLMTWALKLFLRNKVDPAYCTMRALCPGMLMTVIAWKILTFGVVFYIHHFAVSSVYGSLASVFMLMMWVYFLTYLLLYGIQINYVYRKKFSTLSLFKRVDKEKKTAAADTRKKE